MRCMGGFLVSRKGGKVASEMDEVASVLAALPAVRILPLPSSVLIPGGNLPLHVFEPRYRTMISDALLSDRVLGIPLLQPGWEADYEGRPPLHDVMGVGIIRAADRLPDGRYNILVQGVARARIVEEPASSTPYRIVRAVPLQDRIGKGEESRIQLQAQILRQLTVDLAAALPDPAGPSFAQSCVRERDPGRLADLAGAAVLVDTRERQEFLEEPRVEVRLALASDVVAQVLLQVSSGSGGLPI